MLLKSWEIVSRFPLGPQLFSLGLRWYVPYSGSIRPEVVELRPGYAKIRLRDRRFLRNHLNSVHAVALMNLGELTSGLAVTAALPEAYRGIVTKLSIEFYKKARGDLNAVCEFLLPLPKETNDFESESFIYNTSGELICRSNAIWRIGHKPKVA